MKCPTCKSSDGVREILYGIPIWPLDEEKYSLGGCFVTDDNPTRRCIQCGWEGRSKKRTSGATNEIEVVELKDVSTMGDPEIAKLESSCWIRHRIFLTSSYK